MQALLEDSQENFDDREIASDCLDSSILIKVIVAVLADPCLEFSDSALTCLKCISSISYNLYGDFKVSFLFLFLYLK